MVVEGENRVERRQDLGTKIIVGVFVGVVVFLTTQVIIRIWDKSEEAGRSSTQNSIQIAGLMHVVSDIQDMKDDIKAIRNTLYERRFVK